MKLSTLKKEILLVFLRVSSGGERLRPLGMNMIVNEIKERRRLSFKKPLNSVCVRRSLERLLEDGLLNIDTSRTPSIYFLNTRGTRKAREIEEEIRNYMYRWWDFIER